MSIETPDRPAEQTTEVAHGGAAADEAITVPAGPAEIATLPPIERLVDVLPISPRTGEPRRGPWIVAASVLFQCAAVVSGVALCMAWWDAIHMATFPDSTQLVAWWNPRPGSWQSIVAVTLFFALALAMATAASVAGHLSWNGHRASRWVAVAAVVICCGAIALNRWAWPAPVLALLGTGVLWLPVVGRYFNDWARLRASRSIVCRPTPDQVVYGPVTRSR